MTSSFKKGGYIKIQKYKKQNIPNLQQGEKEVSAFVEKDRDQQEQIDVNGNCKEKNSDKYACRDFQVNVPETEISPRKKQYNGKKDNTDKPENKMLKDQMLPAAL